MYYTSLIYSSEKPSDIADVATAIIQNSKALLVHQCEVKMRRVAGSLLVLINGRCLLMDAMYLSLNSCLK